MSLVAAESIDDEPRKRSISKRTPATKADSAAVNDKNGSPSRWTRTGVNFLLDTLLLILFIALATVAVIVRFIFPPGPQAAGWLLWGGTFSDWHRAEFLLLCVLALGILVHVMLHWNWVCSVVAHRLAKWRCRSVQADEGTQTLLGVGLLIVLFNIVGLITAAAALTIVSAQP
ncbi:MAG: hypothetical protein JSS27_11400 [Planctomycetes bacterium]|nr:hypothetical protein [Planctomycetota bacterium]